MEQPGAAGLSVAVARGQELIYSRGHGIAELEFGIEVNGKTLFRIGSVTKQFTAAAIMKLAEQDALSIDDPLTQFLPEYPSNGVEITLRHLLTHTSGVPNYTALGPTWRDFIALELSHEQLLAYWKDLPLDFPPGTRHSYSNSGYYLLGMVIEKVSGTSYSEFLAKNFFGPLGMARTRYGSNSDLIPNRAQGYLFEDEHFLNDDLIGMSQPGAAGALLSTASELVRWQQALVTGQVVSAESYEEMTLPFILDNGDESPYGLGLSLADALGRPCVSHGGGINGFNSILIYFPEEELHIAVISNSEQFNAGNVGPGIAKLLLDSGKSD
jgi:D-alanyl-D-alanine carboxypeptidase